MDRRRLVALIAAAVLPAACGGSNAPPPAAPPPKETPAPEPASGGFDAASLKGPEEPKPETAKPDTPKPDTPKPETPKPATPKPDEKNPAPSDPGEGAPEEKPAEKKSGKAPPASPEAITELEVLASWAEDERQALDEMPPADKAKEIAKRRLEIFKQRGGKIDETAKGAEKPAVGEGDKGPARPDPVREAPPAALRDIMEDLASKDPEIRARGVESARRFSDKTVAAHHLAPLLQDKDPELRVIVCSTLGDLKQADSIPALVKVVNSGDKDTVRAMALKAIGDIGGAPGRAALREIVRESSEPSDRATALGQLVKLREVGEVKDLLAKALDDMNAEVRLQAVNAIREFNLAGFEKELMARLEDASEQVIVEAIRTFGALGTRSSVPALMNILLKPDPDADDPEAMVEAANKALEIITGVKQGYIDTLPDAQKAAALDSWRIWWNKNKATWK